VFIASVVSVIQIFLSLLATSSNFDDAGNIYLSYFPLCRDAISYLFLREVLVS